jgi:hypothetical protein
VAWPKSDGRALSACSVETTAIFIEKPQFFGVCVAALQGFSRRLSTDHCCWTVWINAKKRSDDLAVEAALRVLHLPDPRLDLIHPALPLLGLRHRTWGRQVQHLHPHLHAGPMPQRHLGGGRAGSSGGGSPCPRCGSAAAFGHQVAHCLDPREGEGLARRQVGPVVMWKMRGWGLRTVTGQSGLIQW